MTATTGAAATSEPHAGRRHRVGRSRRRAVDGSPRTDHGQELQRRRERRGEHRATLVREAVLALSPAGLLTHEAVADRTGLPVGHLRWTYPSLTDLVHAGRGPDPIPRTTTDPRSSRS